jgi:hypothetical protein
MKRLVTFFLASTLALTLNGCDGKKSNSNSSTSSTDTTMPDTDTTKHPYSYGYECEGDVVVNGYMLPPCPDPKINDSTLLGIDTNNNNVRDDVERWLIVRYIKMTIR